MHICIVRSKSTYLVMRLPGMGVTVGPVYKRAVTDGAGERSLSGVLPNVLVHVRLGRERFVAVGAVVRLDTIVPIHVVTESRKVLCFHLPSSCDIACCHLGSRDNPGHTVHAKRPGLLLLQVSLRLATFSFLKHQLSLFLRTLRLFKHLGFCYVGLAEFYPDYAVALV